MEAVCTSEILVSTYKTSSVIAQKITLVTTIIFVTALKALAFLAIQMNTPPANELQTDSSGTCPS
jgi:hypothetical protein